MEEQRKRSERFYQASNFNGSYDLDSSLRKQNQELEKILNTEQLINGIDWLSFYKRNPIESLKVNSYLKKIGASFKADDLLVYPEKYDLSYYPPFDQSNAVLSEAEKILRNGQHQYTLQMISNLQEAQKFFIREDFQLACKNIFDAGIVSIGVEWNKKFEKEMLPNRTVEEAAIIAAEGLGAQFCYNILGLLIVYGIKALLYQDFQMLELILKKHM